MSHDLKDTCTPEQRKNVDAWVVAWLQRLRDPDSKQHYGSLMQLRQAGVNTKDEPKCCLGHLGQLAVEAGHAKWDSTVLECNSVRGAGFLPASGCGSFGWKGLIYSGEHHGLALSDLNDTRKMSLTAIADIIENEVIKAPWGGILYTGGKNNAI